jgi:hypothetical protein
MDVIGTTLQGTNTTPPATEESPGYLQRLFVGWVRVLTISGTGFWAADRGQIKDF